MSNKDKYTQPGDDVSQVRSIINQINEDKPSQEKSRELITQKDGSRSVRVVRKRRVPVTAADKRRKTIKHLMLIGLFFVALIVSIMAFFSYRMATMSSEDYVAVKQEELKEMWGAQSVLIEGARVDGFELSVRRVIVKFPANHSLSHAIMTNIKADLSAMTFLKGRFITAQMNVAEASVYWRSAESKLKMAYIPIEQCLDFERISCNKFSAYLAADNQDALLSITNTSAYLYYPKNGDKSNSIFVFNNGSFNVAGWDNFDIKEGRFKFSEAGLTDLNISLIEPGFLVREKQSTFGGESTKEPYALRIVGAIEDGKDFFTPLKFSSSNYNLSKITRGRLHGVFDAMTSDSKRATHEATANITFSAQGGMPQFDGVFSLRQVKWKDLGALRTIRAHMPEEYANKYTVLTIEQASVKLRVNDDELSLQFDEGNMTSPELVRIKGELKFEGKNSISGNLDYAVPVSITRMEYVTNNSDPIFREDDLNGLAWLETEVSGTAQAPSDNTAELEMVAAGKRDLDNRIDLKKLEFDAIEKRVKASTDLMEEASNPEARRSSEREFGNDSSRTTDPLPSTNLTPELSPEPRPHVPDFGNALPDTGLDLMNPDGLLPGNPLY